METFVLDCPIFKKRIEVVRAEQVYANYSGQYIIHEARLVES